MNTKVDDGLFEQWKSEHRDINMLMIELTEWISIQSKQRNSQFEDTVKKLAGLDSQLQAHFAREETLCDRIAESYQAGSWEAEAVRRQSDRDHMDIKNRLKHLIDRMQEAKSEQDAWSEGAYELGLIIDIIEQHEEQESESVCSLLPVNIQKTK